MEWGAGQVPKGAGITWQLFPAHSAQKDQAIHILLNDVCRVFFFCKAHTSRTSLLLDCCTGAVPATGKKPDDHSTRSKRPFTFGELVLISRKTAPSNCDFYAAAAAAASLQSHPTLCDPIDSSPPGSPIPGILQARVLEWVAISFSNA